MKAHIIAYLASFLFFGLSSYSSLSRIRERENIAWMNERLSEPYDILKSDYPQAYDALRDRFEYVELNTTLANRRSEISSKLEFSAIVISVFFLLIGILQNFRYRKNEPNK